MKAPTAFLCSLFFVPTLVSGQTVPQFEIKRSFKLGGEGGWDYLTLLGNRLFISRSDRIDVVDTRSGKLIGKIGGLKGTHQAVFATKLGKGFTSNGGDSSVTVFDLKTLKVLNKVKVGDRADAILFDAHTNRVFTFNAASHDATAVDAESEKVVGSVALGGKPEFPVNDGAGHVFVNIEDTSEVAEFDAGTLKVIKRWSIKPGEEPTGLAFDAKHHRLFSVTGGKMMVSDSKAGRVVTTIPVGEGPDAAAYDSKMGLVFSSNGEGSLTVVKEVTPDKFEVVQTLSTKRSARTCVLDPKSHWIYLAAADTVQPEGGGRRKVVPGSFEIIAVGPK